jgi:hypothetical protein
MSFFLFLVLVIVVILWLTRNKKLQKVNSDLNEKLHLLEKKHSDIQKAHQELDDKVQRLAKYDGLLDIEDKAAEILTAAENNVAELNAKAQETLGLAQQEAETVRAASKEDASSLKKQSELLYSLAKADADKLIAAANLRAEEIAGDAIYALQNKKELEKTARALKNIIDGYGDQYLVPTFSILDDLADEFGHTEAGLKLKEAREFTRRLIKANQAATCEYVETNRKTTAINFVLDAFNGKVDSVLSKVKKDNYGTLEQKIRDAFNLVTINGKAFRDAAITQEYLDARLSELKWGVITNELKWKEQEEQRMIREQIREEEKVRREFEKAMKEAQKEEETLKRLIEKAQKEVGLASAAEKAKFEDQLRELEAKLKEAEEKNQRVLSMAQQTKAGNVYIISNIGSFGENVYKIGMTRRLEPLDRIRELGDASVPFEFDVHSMIYSEDAPGLERELHKRFLRLQMNKVNPKKEFFKINLSDIKEVVDKMGISAKWTMTAEARQYKESLTIEQAIVNDSLKREEWERYQLEFDPISAEPYDDDEPLSV